MKSPISPLLSSKMPGTVMFSFPLSPQQPIGVVTFSRSPTSKLFASAKSFSSAI